MTGPAPKRKEAPRPKRSTLGGLDDAGSALVPVDRALWLSIDAEARIEQLRALDQRYHQLTDELYNSANLCVDRNQNFLKATRIGGEL